MSDDRPSQCPSCASKRVALILYGLPADFTPELMEKLETGKVVLGGCTVTGEDTKWHCVDCEHEWGDAQLFSNESESA